jgi:hypothetical protein
MTLEEAHKEIFKVKNELAKVPQLEARLHRLLGMEEILLELQEEKKPELEVASSDAS